MFSSQAHFNLAFSSALIEGHIVPHFQPIVSLKDESIVGFEALARWHDVRYGEIRPASFIPRADRGGMLDELLDVLMRQAFTAAQSWPGDTFVSFNVSPAQLRNVRLIDLIRNATTDCNFPLSRVHIEITETAILEDQARAAVMLEYLVGLGCSISMDDFGTGYSSLTWLRTMPFSTIKIDASFVGLMRSKKETRKIVTAVIGLGQSLGLSVIAEGVETAEQAELLRHIGCSEVQGFLYGGAVPADQVSGLLAAPIHIDLQADPPKLSLEQRAYQISALYGSDNMSVCFLDPNFHLLHASEAFFRRLHRAFPAAIGDRARAISLEETDRVAWLRTQLGHGPLAPVYRRVLPMGSVDLMFVHPVRDEVGDMLGYSVIALEIMGRRTVEQAPPMRERNCFWYRTLDWLRLELSELRR